MKEKGKGLREEGMKAGQECWFYLVTWLEEVIWGEQPPCPGVWMRLYLLLGDDKARELLELAEYQPLVNVTTDTSETAASRTAECQAGELICALLQLEREATIL